MRKGPVKKEKSENKYVLDENRKAGLIWWTWVRNQKD